MPTTSIATISSVTVKPRGRRSFLIGLSVPEYSFPRRKFRGDLPIIYLGPVPEFLQGTRVFPPILPDLDPELERDLSREEVLHRGLRALREPAQVLAALPYDDALLAV